MYTNFAAKNIIHGLSQSSFFCNLSKLYVPKRYLNIILSEIVIFFI